VWLNIFAVSALLFSSLSSLSSLISYFLLLIVLKKEDCRKLKILCIRWGIIFSVGIFLVLILHFFHILNFSWGLGILTVVILASFVI
jgi:amino acid transporter